MNWRNLGIYKWSKKVWYSIVLFGHRKKGVKNSVNNFQFRVPVSCYKYFQSRYFPKVYEPENFDFFRRHMKEGMTCIDIGAHIGLYAVFMSKQCHAKVFSFEPTPTSQQIFRDMMAVNNCQDQVTLIPAAVSSSSGKTTFYMTNTPLWVGNSLYLKNFASTDMKGYEVDVFSVDDFVSRNNIPVDFIKIDAEGAELEVLNGAKNTLLKHKPAGILGIHPNTFDDKKDTYEKIFDTLEGFGLHIMYDNKDLSRDQWMTELMKMTNTFDLQFCNKALK